MVYGEKKLGNFFFWRIIATVKNDILYWNDVLYKDNCGG